MFTTEELSNFEKQFQEIGITSRREQKIVLDYFYNLGKITYILKIKEDEKIN